MHHCESLAKMEEVEAMEEASVVAGAAAVVASAGAAVPVVVALAGAAVVVALAGAAKAAASVVVAKRMLVKVQSTDAAGADIQPAAIYSQLLILQTEASATAAGAAIVEGRLDD